MMIKIAFQTTYMDNRKTLEYFHHSQPKMSKVKLKISIKAMPQIIIKNNELYYSYEQ